MAVTLSDDDFEALYGYFYRAYSAVSNDSVPELLKQKDEVWRILQRIAAEHGRDMPDPAEEMKAKVQAQLDQGVSRRRLPKR
ncbi:MAG TPA: hypothetical protein VFI41_04845 [Gemmatimonadales bacterium]|nr:hypothetical protein [Gemmatimonadales bacterium]